MKQTLFAILIVLCFTSCDQQSIDNAGSLTGKFLAYGLIGLFIYFIAIRPFTKKKK